MSASPSAGSSPASSSGTTYERTASRRSSAATRPSAESTPAAAGTRTVVIPSSSASAHACSGPAPPKATSAKSRGSSPCSTETTRSARTISAFTTSITAAGSRSPSARRAAVAVEHHASCELAGEPVEQEVRVRDRRALAALPVARRPGLGARALGAHAQRSAGVLPHDRAAARADRVHGDRREADGEAADLALVLPPRLPVHDRADVGRGPAHVERERVREAGELGDSRGAHDPRGRAREQRERRVARRLAERRDAARGAHDERLDEPGAAARRSRARAGSGRAPARGTRR